MATPSSHPDSNRSQYATKTDALMKQTSRRRVKTIRSWSRVLFDIVIFNSSAPVRIDGIVPKKLYFINVNLHEAVGFIPVVVVEMRFTK